MRPIFYAPETYPRYVGSARGDIPAYASQTPNQIAFKPIGYIPEVAHTYAYHEETYGALNEKQVGIGESTCSGVFGTSAAGHGGQALLSVDTLSQIAMERSDSARHAVSLMGALAEKHGFYGAGSFEGTAESLMVTDPREGFIFHVLPDPTGTSAIWVSGQPELNMRNR
jgi:dipeptidase